MNTTTSIRRRISRRTAVATVAFMSVAVPAGASVLIQNFIVANIDASAPCFTKIGGSDTTNFGTVNTGPYAAVNTATTLTASNGVSLINETVTIKGFAGDRTRYTDVIRYRNNCAYPVTIRLVAEADPTTGSVAVESGWDMAVNGYLSKTVAPVSSTSLDTDAVNWDQQFSISNTGVVTAAGAAQTVAAGSELQGAFSVDVPTGSTTTRTFHFTATATA